MALTVEDIINLRRGEAPDSPDLIGRMTIGTNVWLDSFFEYYLDGFIPRGGSKVKILVGNEGTGKSHALKYIQYVSRMKGYASVYISARNTPSKIHDIPGLYRLIAQSIDMDRVVTGLSLKVAESLGYNKTIYDGKGKLLPYIIEEGYGAYDGAREIRIAIAKTLKDADFSPSLFTCAFTLLKDRLFNDEDSSSKTAIRWLRGEKLERYEKQALGIFEVLNKPNGRRWLDSLLKLIVFSGMKGLVILLDDMDVMYERSPETGRFLYTPGNVKDTCELIRQIIDDGEMLKGLMLVLGGRKNLIEDEKRGFVSYEALWMRLQTGLVASHRFNSLSDIVDMDRHLEELGEDFPRQLSEHLSVVFEEYGIRKKLTDGTVSFNSDKPLKAAVMENANMGGQGVEFNG